MAFGNPGKLACCLIGFLERLIMAAQAQLAPA